MVHQRKSSRRSSHGRLLCRRTGHGLDETGWVECCRRPVLAVSTTGVNGGFVLIEADDPGIHSSQGEQDNRHFAELAKVPILEPIDSQSAYDLMACAFEISEQFDTPIMLRSTTRISHSKSIVAVKDSRTVSTRKIGFSLNMQRWVMLPVNARVRHVAMEDRMQKLAVYAETFPFNQLNRATAAWASSPPASRINMPAKFSRRPRF